MPYIRPPTRLQQLCEVPRFAVKNILSDLILGPVISLGAEWLHTQAAVFKKTPQEYSDEAWKSMKYNMKPVRLVRGLYADAVLEPERVRRNRRLAVRTLFNLVQKAA